MAEKKNGIIQEYFDGNNLKKYFIFNDKKEGEYKHYWENGQLREICNYKDGKKEGTYKEYYENGQLREIYNYKDEKKEGKCIKYYNDGYTRIMMDIHV